MMVCPLLLGQSHDQIIGIRRNFHQEEIFANFITCAHWQNFTFLTSIKGI